MSACTWKGCTDPGNHPQVAIDGERWASLCDDHLAELQACAEAREILRSWVLAQGGADAATRRMLG